VNHSKHGPDSSAGPAAFVAATFAEHSPRAVAVALSGGLDSMVLLHLAFQAAGAAGVPLFAFHVHHGLSPNADRWRAHCEQAAAALGVAFDGRAVTVEKGKSGVEAAARKLRYAALGELCRIHGVDLLLTAHHLDDQAETVLLQLLRGSGPAGLSGMETANRAPSLLGTEELVMARPLLSVSRAELEALAGEQHIAWVEDESNTDPRYARNALRHQVMPVLAQAFPGFQRRIARSGAHAQSAQRLLNELAEQDLAACRGDGRGDGDDESIDLTRLRKLSPDRINNLLRHWFSNLGLGMPSTAWLEQMVAQLLSARGDSQPLVAHPEVDVRRHRDRLHLVPKLPELAGMRDPDDEGIFVKHAQAFTWNGEAGIAFPDYGGVLHFDTAERGIDPVWLRGRPLAIDFRKGGERLKLAPNRPTRGLKQLFQAHDVPAWQRSRLPIVSSGPALLYAAGLGMDCRFVSEGEGRIALRWEGTATL
jgi:tRNA(Ile)-lysidine synthase